MTGRERHISGMKYGDNEIKIETELFLMTDIVRFSWGMEKVTSFSLNFSLLEKNTLNTSGRQDETMLSCSSAATIIPRPLPGKEPCVKYICAHTLTHPNSLCTEQLAAKRRKKRGIPVHSSVEHFSAASRVWSALISQTHKLIWNSVALPALRAADQKEKKIWNTCRKRYGP